MIAFGTLPRGICAELAGRNFFKGFVTKVIVAGLNHAAHVTVSAQHQESRTSNLQAIKRQYPRFYEVLEQLPSYLEANPKILLSLSVDTGLSTTKVLELLNVNSPKGQVIALARMKDLGLTGHLSKTYINADLVEKFEVLQTAAYIQGTSFLLAVTVLHEFVHWGRASNALKSDGPKGEDYGNYWEKTTFGTVTGIKKQ